MVIFVCMIFVIKKKDKYITFTHTNTKFTDHYHRHGEFQIISLSIILNYANIV